MFKIMDSKSIIEPPRGIQVDDKHKPLLPRELRQLNTIEFHDVHFSYPRKLDIEVLQGMNIQINAGQKVAFVGESGSGKSTMIQLLERFYDPTVGAITANGFDLKDLPVFGWRGIIGYVGQEPALSAMSILENIRLGDPTASDQDVAKAAKMARADEFINTLPDKYETHVGSSGAALSGGQKQRIAIARALIRRPKILLLDEATSALDNESEKMVQETIDGLQSRDGESRDLIVVTVAHRLSTIRHSDTIFFLSKGQIAEQGTHDQLMNLRGGYHALVETQAMTVDEAQINTVNNHLSIN